MIVILRSPNKKSVLVCFWASVRTTYSKFAQRHTKVPALSHKNAPLFEKQQSTPTPLSKDVSHPNPLCPSSKFKGFLVPYRYTIGLLNFDNIEQAKRVHLFVYNKTARAYKTNINS